MFFFQMITLNNFS